VAIAWLTAAWQSKAMSLYGKCWLFTTWIFFVFFSFPLWSGFDDPRVGGVYLLIVIGTMLSQVFVMSALRCPNCGLTPFRSSKDFWAWRYPWPRTFCGHCGRDHRAIDDRKAR
jgi:hypothetical protein